MSLNRPFYECRPIGSVAALARAVGVPEGRLRALAKKADRLYRGPIVIQRPGRNPRSVYSAAPRLRDIQQRILDRVLRRVRLPDYLMGGVKTRSYIDNARKHTHSRVLFGQDVDAFYPSISQEAIKLIFLDVLHFAPEVAQLLAQLTARRGALVQGGVASTDLANLALYRTEPELEWRLHELQISYSRFVDDAYASSRRPLSARERTNVVKMMRACLERPGYRPKRKKQFVATPGTPMHVHGLNVNSSASMPTQRRQRLRNEVFLVEQWARLTPWDAAIERAHLRLRARVGQLTQTNPGEARRLKRRLQALLSMRSVALTPPERVSLTGPAA
jgi:hypothetical protein